MGRNPPAPLPHAAHPNPEPTRNPPIQPALAPQPVAPRPSPLAARRSPGAPGHGTWADSAGSVEVAELDWVRVAEQLPPLGPPFDFVIAADCVYHEHIVEHFHRVVMEATGDKSLGGWVAGWLAVCVLACGHGRNTIVHTRASACVRAPSVWLGSVQALLHICGLTVEAWEPAHGLGGG